MYKIEFACGRKAIYAATYGEVIAVLVEYLGYEPFIADDNFVGGAARRYVWRSKLASELDDTTGAIAQITR